MSDNIDEMIKRIKLLHNNLLLDKTIATGVFMPNGVKFSSNEEEALLQARIQAARSGGSFPENEDADLDKIDDQVINKMIDDMLND